MSTEDVCIKNIEAAIRGIRMGTKKPDEVAGIVNKNMAKLKETNEGMQLDLMEKYKQVLIGYQNKTKN